MLNFTELARTKVRDFIDRSDGELPYLRIGVEGSPLAPSYVLTLVSEEERDGEEVQVDLEDFTVLVSPSHEPRLKGATVDFVERVNETGFEVRPDPAVLEAAATSDGEVSSEEGEAPSGPIADRVREVLDAEVNPGIASHGGHIGLADVQGTEIYLEMSGGCQGCAMSRLTLRQGVERMLRQEIPEITAIHDITDHASGTNPFYEA